MTRPLTSFTFILFALAGLGACGSSSSAGDDAAVDASLDIASDQQPSDVSEASATDGSLAPTGVVYHHTISGKSAIRKVGPSVPSSVAFDASDAFVYEPKDAMTGAPTTAHQGRLLPGVLGRLLGYGSPSPGVCGFIAVRPSGEVVDLGHLIKQCPADSGPFDHLCDCGTHIAVRKDTGVVVTVDNTNGAGALVLLRTDGKKWTNMTHPSVFCPVLPTVDFVLPDTIVLSDKHIFALGKINDPSSGLYLMRATPDCTEREAKAIQLPIKGGVTNLDLLVSEAGDRVFFRAKVSATDEALMVTDTASRNARVVASLSPATKVPLRTYIAISPKGTHIAYRDDGSLTVHAVDAAAPSSVILPGAAFASGVKPLPSEQSLLWVNEDLLLFAAGAADSGDLYSYTLSTKTVKRLTNTSSATSPYHGDGTITIEHFWLSPDQSVLYFVEAQKDKGTGTVSRRDIRAFRRAPGKLVSITKDMEDVRVAVERGRFTIGKRAPTSDRFFFVATAGAVDNLYSIDLNQPEEAPRMLTQNTQTSVRYSLPNPSDDGVHVSFFRSEAGKHTLHVATLDGSDIRLRKLADLVSNPTADTKAPIFASDGSIVTYAGLEYGDTALRWQRTDGASPAKIVENTGHSMPFAVY